VMTGAITATLLPRSQARRGNNEVAAVWSLWIDAQTLDKNEVRKVTGSSGCQRLR
jgi:hypothetical protein